MADDLLRLLLRPVAMTDTQSTAERFYASREDTGVHVVTSHIPLYAGARVLLDGGCLPTTLLTTRHAGREYDNFIPAPIGRLATRTLREGRDGLRSGRFKSHFNKR